MAVYDTAITCPRGASMPMPRESTTIIISAMQIIENSDNINTFYNPMSYTEAILTRQYMGFQGIYFLFLISDLMLLILVKMNLVELFMMKMVIIYILQLMKIII